MGSVDRLCFLRKHIWKILTVLFGLASMASLVLYLFFPDLSSPKRDPKFFVDRTRSIILHGESMEDAPITVYKHDSVRINSSVCAATFYLWNAGEQPIEPSDVLSPIQVYLGSPGAEILRLDTLATSDSVCGLGFTLSATAVSPQTLIAHFKILEHADGGAFQIIYEGSPDTPVRISGRVVGKLDLAHADHQHSEGQTYPRTSAWWKVLLFAGFTVFGAEVLSIVFRRFGRGASLGLLSGLRLVSVITLGIALLYFAYISSASSPPTPPAEITARVIDEGS